MLSSIKRNAAVVDITAIVSVWLISLLIAHPVGNFPLNDDWSLGMTAQRLLLNGEFRPTGWTSMTLLSQVLWGALFCLPTGFSFTALRLSTLTLSIGGVIGVYCLLRLVNLPRWFAVTAGLTLAFNPVYYLLSNTFMTDVPFTCMQVWALYFFVRYLQKEADCDLVIATLITIAAVLCRQVGIFAPLSFTITCLLLRGVSKQSLPRALFPSALAIATLFLFQFWLKTSGRLPHVYFEKSSRVYDIFYYPLFAADNFLRNSWIELLYLGLFLLPVLVFCQGKNIKPASTAKNLISGGAAGGFILYSLFRLVKLGQTMPLQKSIIVKEGLGPLTLYDSMILGMPNTPPLSNSFWITVTVLSVAGAALLFRQLLVLLLSFADGPGKKLDREKGIIFFFLFFAGAYLLPFLTTEISDRYLLPVVPALLACLGTAVPRTEKPNSLPGSTLAVLSLVGFLLFSTVGTRDYFAWNQARWDLISDLAKRGQLSPREMDGGYEFNGWYLYDSSYVLKPGMSWWWVNDNRFLIAFGPVPGWTAMAEKKYSHGMPPFKGSMLLLKRNE